MPEFDNFPLLSDPNKTTAQAEGWGANLEERALQIAGKASVGSAKSARNPGDQWLRRFSLIVYSSTSNQSDLGHKSGGQGGLELGMLRVDFNIKKASVANPNFLYAKIYNLSLETVKSIRQYSRVQLAAGYKYADNYGIIFDGTIELYIIGKENPVDSYLEIYAGDNDQMLSRAMIAQTWPAGTTPEKMLQDKVKTLNAKIGTVKLTGADQKSVRSSSYIGPTTEGIRNITDAYPADFFIEDGKVNVIPWEGYLPGEIVELSPTTGLVGVPKVTPNGIECQCLLNPKLRLAGLVKIEATRRDKKTGKLLHGLSGIAYTPGAGDDMNSVGKNPGASGAQGTGGVGGGGGTAPISFPATGTGFTFGIAAVNPEGIYKILELQHYGDTRGNPWYSAMMCVAAGQNGELLPNTFYSPALSRSFADVDPKKKAAAVLKEHVESGGEEAGSG